VHHLHGPAGGALSWKRQLERDGEHGGHVEDMRLDGKKHLQEDGTFGFVTVDVRPRRRQMTRRVRRQVRMHLVRPMMMIGRVVVHVRVDKRRRDRRHLDGDHEPQRHAPHHVAILRDLPERVKRGSFLTENSEALGT
jgi:hypothetical protein